MSDARAIIENTLVPHTAFREASMRLKQCYEYAEGAAEPICMAVLGESRTGKSRALEECFVEHPPRRDEDGLTVPILYVKTPSKPTVKGLAALMLQAIGDPRWHAGSEIEKTNRLRTLMFNANTKMVMIDEFQHFYDKASHKVMHHVADWLKILVDDAKVALVVAGLPDCRAVLDQNEQLAGRFLAPVTMHRFDWKREEHRAEFMGILAAFHEAMSEHFDVPELHTPELAFRFYCGTGGLMGYLTKLLRQAVWNALDEERRTVTLEDFARAHQQAVWRPEGSGSELRPFSRDFILSPTEELLAMVRALGTPALETRERTTRGGGGRSRRRETFQQVVSR
mgnify:CR=1 FL=1|jgi:Bacterial TniB protein.